MRRPAWVRKSGPFKCESQINGYIEIKPSWPQYGAVWQVGRGGGPGVFGRMGLAEDLEKWLNSIYTEAEIVEGRARIAEHDQNLNDGWPDPRDKQLVKLKTALQLIASYGRPGRHALRDIMANIAATALVDTCLLCGRPMQDVRPGKVQCPRCD